MDHLRFYSLPGSVVREDACQGYKDGYFYEIIKLSCLDKSSGVERNILSLGASFSTILDN